MAKYNVRSGFRHVHQKEAPLLVKEFISLEKRLKRPPTAEDIVKVAQKGGTVFWAVFERAGMWDDAHAAQVARLNFARYVIRAIEVRLEATDGAVEHAAFIPIRHTDADPLPEGGYLSAEAVLADEAMRRAYLRRLQATAKRAAEEAAAWAWLISTVPAAEEFVAAARKFAAQPEPA